MAKNWKFGEAVRAIKTGNKEEIMDIGRRFPLFLNLATQVNEAAVELIDCVPDYCTARKIESVLKGEIQEAESTEEEEVVEEAPKAADKKKAPAKKAAVEEDEDEEDDLESKSAKELFDMCKAAGLTVKPKQDKAVYIKALNASEEKAEEEDWDEAEEEEAPAKKAPAKKEAAKKEVAKKAPAKKAKEEDEDWDV